MLTLCVRHLTGELVHSQKIMDVSDLQVSDKDGCRSRSNTIKANSKIVKERIWTLDSQFANQIVTEQIWVISVTSKIVLQPLVLDTDAQLHKERVTSVRNEASFVSRVLGGDQGCAENCRDSTSAKISTDDPDDDSQQGPEHADARPRVESSAVVRYDDADLEQTNLR